MIYNKIYQRLGTQTILEDQFSVGFGLFMGFADNNKIESNAVNAFIEHNKPYLTPFNTQRATSMINELQCQHQRPLREEKLEL